MADYKRQISNLKAVITGDKGDIRCYGGILAKAKRELAKHQRQLRALEKEFASDVAIESASLDKAVSDIGKRSLSSAERYELFKRLCRTYGYTRRYVDRLRRNGKYTGPLSVKIDPDWHDLKLAHKKIFRKLADKVRTYSPSVNTGAGEYKTLKDRTVERYQFDVPKSYEVMPGRGNRPGKRVKVGTRRQK